MLYLLILILFIEYCFGLLIFKEDIGTPSLIVCAAMMFSVLIGIIGNNLYWQTDIHPNTVYIIGISIFFIIMGDRLSANKFYKRSSHLVDNESVFKIEKWKMVLIILGGIITIILQYINLYQNTGSGNLSDILFQYRLLYNAGELEYEQSGILSLMCSLTTWTAYISLFICIHNSLKTKKVKKNLVYLIPVLIFCLNGLLNGARGNIVDIFLAGIFYYYFVYEDIHNWKRKYNFKLIIRTLFIAGGGLVFFVGLGGLIGRKQSGVMEEISVYAGAESILFDRAINDSKFYHYKFGRATFDNIYMFVHNRLNVKIQSVDILHQYRMENGHFLGNVYSAILPWYIDFGIIGVVVLSLIFGMIFSYVYRKISACKSSSFYISGIIIYGYFVNSLFLFIFNDRFYSKIGPSLIKEFFLFYILKKFFFNVHINNRKLIIT